MPRPLRLFIVLTALLALTRPAACQSTDFKTLLSSSSLPLTLTLKDLDSGWRRVSPGFSSGAADPAQAYSALFVGGAGNVYYTQGETVTVAGETFLVTYHHQVSFDFAALMKSMTKPGAGPPKPPKLTRDTPLSLSLLNLRLLGSLGDIQPFSLSQEIGDTASAAQTDPAQASVSNLKQIGLAMILYTNANKDQLPPMRSIDAAQKALAPYVKDSSAFQQPQTHTPYRLNTSLSLRPTASVENPSETLSFYEAGPASDGTGGVLTLDGHARRVQQSEWAALKASSQLADAAPQ